MEDYLSFNNNRLYGSFIDINETHQNNLSNSDPEDYLDAYGQKIKHIAEMLLYADWYILKKDDGTFETIITGIKDVIGNFSYLDCDGIEGIISSLHEILDHLYIAGEIAVERNSKVRTARHHKFSQCHKDLVRVAKQLCKSMT